MIFTEAERNNAVQLFTLVREITSSGIGVERPSYSDGESAALNLVAEVASRHGIETRLDQAANLVMTLTDKWPQDAIVLGSHLDSVPQGGNYDGLAGVVAALLILIKAKVRGDKLPLVGLGLRGEESAWYGIPYMGSKALLGKLMAEDLQRKRGVVSRTLQEAMMSCGANIALIARQERFLPTSVKEFWELHIEQGPVLVDAESPIGIVTAIRGNVRASSARIFGQAGHSGTTPHALRKDAVLRFAEMLVAAEAYRAELAENGKDIVMTCGIVGTIPEKHAMTTIADEVGFSLDIRSTDPAIASGMFDFVKGYARDWVDWGTVVTTEGMTVAPERVARARRAAYKLSIPCISLPSGAGHDAAIFQQAGIPSGMIFVRNRNGSHNPHEAMDIDDFMLGVETLYRTIST